MDPWKNVAHLSKQEINRTQSKQLHSYINKHVYPFSPHYKKVFDECKIDPRSIKSVDDLQRLPFTSKLDLANESEPDKFKDFILKPTAEKIKNNYKPLELADIMCRKILRGKDAFEDSMNQMYRPVFMTFTTGTTNTPVPFVYSNYDLNNLRISGHRMLRLFNIAPDDKIVNIFPFAPHLAFWQVVFGGFEAAALILSTGGGKVLGTSGNIAAIEKMKPSTLLGVPSYIYHLLREAKHRNVKMPYVKNIVLGASRITRTFKEKIASLLQEMGAGEVCVFGTYGFTEARSAWAECPTSLDTSSGYFLYPDKEIFEVVNPDTGEVLGEGESGELVYTSLDARGSVVLRYRTGDYVNGGITYEQCPHTKMMVPRISSDITRLSNVKELQLSKIKGTLVNLNNFEGTLNKFPEIDEWQVEIGKKDNDPHEMDVLKLYLTTSSTCNTEKLAEMVHKEVVATTEISPNTITFIPMEEMVKRLELETANKEKRILDSRPKE